MAEYRAWRDDGEARVMAKLLVMHSPSLAHIDLYKICFIRSDDDIDAPVRAYPNKYPYSLSSSCDFIIQTFTAPWNALSKAQKQRLLTKILSSIPNAEARSLAMNINLKRMIL